MFLHLIEADGPRYRQVYAALRRAILSGELAGGARLPSTRTLAQSTGLSRITVQLAFEQLLAEGYVEARVGSGTYVVPGVEPTAPTQLAARPAARPPRLSAFARRLAGGTPLLSGRGHNRPRPRYDFRHGLPDLAALPRARWRRLLGRQTRRAERTAYDYGPAAGAPALRAAIAAYLRRARGLACDEAQGVIGNGAQQGRALCG
ncbi:MAG: GntR family transcriptional regulator, partial [Deltaproteobacteria bacterium]|nr:GntR family transcriptional regulator [Deltaproteobacteria bacterium]